MVGDDENLLATADATGPLKGGAVPPIAAKLVVVAGPDEGLDVALDGVAVAGTDPAAQLVLHDPAVSRRHVSFAAVGGKVLVKDLGSRNGTFLGDAKLHEGEVPLGAVLRIGNSAIALHSRWYVREIQPSTARRFGELIGESLAMREVFAILARVAPTDVTVLVDGESGTGKELCARSIHQASTRAKGPYLVFDCGSVPPELAESELFGHRRGSFSGAVSDRAGAFQGAHGGTLCLDEIGEFPLELQPKLLRALETSEIRPVGEDKPRKVDVRIVAATNRDLHAEARRGRFRSDLLYRLEVVRVRLPPLRQRPEDIPLLVTHLLKGKLPSADLVGGDNLNRLLAYSWPGNVRELRNALTRATALARKQDGSPAAFAELVFNLGPAASSPVTIGLEFPGVSSSVPYKDAKRQLLESFDRAYVGALLERHHGSVRQAAAAAELSRKHLYELIRRTTSVEDVQPEED